MKKIMVSLPDEVSTEVEIYKARRQLETKADAIVEILKCVKDGKICAPTQETEDAGGGIA